jgi:hypothetical protein
MRRPLKVSDVRLEDYDAVYLPGGHGPMADLAFDADVGRLLTAQLATSRKRSASTSAAARSGSRTVPATRLRTSQTAPAVTAPGQHGDDEDEPRRSAAERHPDYHGKRDLSDGM